MKPTKRLILGLRETAQELRRDETDYDWDNSRKCNCGLLSRNLGWHGEYVQGTWSTNAYAVERCSITRRPILELFAFLKECGLETTDIVAIEYCSKDQLEVATWMDAKADELERQRATLKEKEVM